MRLGSGARRALWGAVVLLALHLPGPAPLEAQTPPAGEACSIAEPLWYAPPAPGSTASRAWTTGRRDDGACRRAWGGWTQSTWSSSIETQRPDGLAAPAVGAIVAAGGGVHLRHGALELRIAPEVAWHQNRDVEIPEPRLASLREFGYTWSNIDLPHRFGPDPFTLLGPGRSGIRLHGRSVSVGVDAEPVRWGPSRRYPLLLSGQQASLPRVGFRTERPWDLGSFGTLDVNLFYGRLTPSEWFREEDAEDRVLSGLAVAWGPGVFPGLTLGVASLHHQDADAFGFGSAFDWARSLLQSDDTRVVGNGLASVWVAWASPDRGFDVWLELVRDDFNRDFGQLLLEPGKGSGVTFGLRQESEWGSGTLSAHFEATRTRNARPATDDESPGRGIMYTNGEVREGHTHRGQLLGAIVGPGGDGQFLEVAFSGAARTAVQVERIRYNTDAYTEVLDQPLGDEGYDVELVGRLLHERPFGDVRARAELEVGARHNRLFLEEDPGWGGTTRLGLMLLWSR